MNRKQTFLCMFVVCMCCLLAGCGPNEASKQKEEKNMEMYNRLTIAWNFTMTGNVDINEARFLILDEKAEYDNIYLFATKEEADQAVEEGKFGEKDIYAYPTDTTETRLNFLNYLIESKEIKDKLADYGLEYPITIDDIVNKTESIRELIYNRDLFTISEFAQIAR